VIYVAQFGDKNVILEQPPTQGTGVGIYLVLLADAAAVANPSCLTLRV
jgi:hypothetical protein